MVYASKILFVFCISMIVVACGGAQPASLPALPSEMMVHIKNGVLDGTPDSFVQFSQLAREGGKVLVSTGTVASSFETGPAFLAAGYPESVATAAGNSLLSWEQMEAAGVTFCCFNRHSMVAVVPGIELNNKANGLWVAGTWANEPVPGISFNTAATYAKNGIILRHWDSLIANQKLIEAQSRVTMLAPIVEGGSATLEQIAEYNMLKTQYIPFESQRISFFVNLQANNPTEFALWNKMRQIPVVVVGEFDLKELTRKTMDYQNGPGTRIASGNWPFSRIKMVYIDAADASDDVLAVFRSKGIPVEITGTPQTAGSIATAEGLWQQMPSQMYNLAFKTGRLADTAIQYATIAGAYLVMFTPAGVKVIDYLQVAGGYQAMLDSQLGNFSETEFYELNNDWLNTLAGMSQDPITHLSYYQPLFDMMGVDSSNPYRGGWSMSDWISVGQSGDVPFSIKEGTAEHHVLGDGSIMDLPALVAEYNPNPVTYLEWIGTGPKIRWESGPHFTSPAEVVLGSDQPGGWYLYNGCVEYLDTNDWVSYFTEIRYQSSPDHLQIRIFTRPQLFVGQNCIVDVTLP